jgi:hypothetical protein
MDLMVRKGTNIDIPARPQQNPGMMRETQKPIPPHPRTAEYSRAGKKQIRR